MKQRLVACLMLAALTLGASRARAGLIAYDGFSYPPGQELVQQTGGTGFSGGWAAGGFNAGVSNNYTVGGNSLSDGNLSTSGGDAFTAATGSIAGLTRGLATPLGTPGTTDYISVLLRPDGPITGGTFNNFFGLYLNASTTNSTADNDVFIGKPGNGPINDYDIETRGGTNQFDSGVAAVTGQTALLVLRVDFFSTGSERFELFVNPTPGGTEPVLGTVKEDVNVGTITGLTLYSTGAFSVDEIRIGTTYADVVPTAANVPEPSSAVLASMGALGVVALVRSRRRARPHVLTA